MNAGPIWEGLGGDAVRWGASDFYEENEEALRKALESGKDFDTGWGSCKKEILSVRVTRGEGQVRCLVSVSNDFDEEAVGEVVLPDGPELDMEAIVRALDLAHEKASLDQEDNSTVGMWIVGKVLENGETNWIETYLEQLDDGFFSGLDCGPPGDYHHWWGWQDQDPDEDPLPEEGRNVPAEVREMFEAALADESSELRASGKQIFGNTGWGAKEAK